jgi:hypothetical protein
MGRTSTEIRLDELEADNKVLFETVKAASALLAQVAPEVKLLRAEVDALQCWLAAVATLPIIVWLVLR